MTHRTALFGLISITAFAWTTIAPPAQAQSPSLREQLHANAVASFQQGRFPEAYGRVIALANAGHAPAADLALFMAQNAISVFGKDWDVTQEELSAWAALAGRPAPVLRPQVYTRAATRAALAAR